MWGGLSIGLFRRSIDESPDIELDFQWTQFPKKSRPTWPLDVKQMLDARSYDVLILSDIDSAAIGRDNCSLIADLIADGKGLMMLGGRQSFGAGGYQQTALAEVLPVQMGRLQRQRPDQPLRTDLHRTEELTMIPTTDHFVTRLADRANNLTTWESLPKLTGANRFGEVSERAIVLAKTADGMPLLVAGEYGVGRVLAMAGDSTYRWIRYDRQLEHKRFWRQSILWLARKEDSIRRDVWIDLEQRRFPIGAGAAFTLGARDATGEEIPDTAFQVELVLPTGEVRTHSVTQHEGTWSGTTGPLDQPGEYSLRVVAILGGKELGTATRPFVVQANDLELSDPAANPNQIQALTQVTSAAGGRTIAMEQLPELIKSIIDNPPETEEEIEMRWQFADQPKGAWSYFICFVVVLSGEWWLRKKWHMV